ncbi:MAG: hypothetical protein U5P41_11480 [Gammaproteobacteria bacterium]|nr:hypothetical protein [Gammaproteobacteria bacterium]
MKAPSERIIFDTDNPLFKRAHPVLLTLFCKGVQETTSKQLVLAAGLAILISPMRWIIYIFRRGVHIVIVLAVWWLLRDELAGLGVSDYVFLGVALVVVLYKEIYQELVDVMLYLLIVVTAGVFLRWMCAGYLSGTGFRQYALTQDPMSRVIGTMVNAISQRYRVKYEEIMNLYLDYE